MPEGDVGEEVGGASVQPARARQGQKIQASFNKMRQKESEMQQGLRLQQLFILPGIAETSAIYVSG